MPSLIIVLIIIIYILINTKKLNELTLEDMKVQKELNISSEMMTRLKYYFGNIENFKKFKERYIKFKNSYYNLSFYPLNSGMDDIYYMSLFIKEVGVKNFLTKENKDIKGSTSDYGYCQVTEIAYKDIIQRDKFKSVMLKNWGKIFSFDEVKNDARANIFIGTAYLHLCYQESKKLSNNFYDIVKLTYLKYNAGIKTTLSTANRQALFNATEYTKIFELIQTIYNRI